MLKSIFDDLKYGLRSGSTVTKIILVNAIVFVVFGVILKSFLPAVYDLLIPFLALSSDVVWNLTHPWVFITHIFIHAGFFHILWNMLQFYWFGNIVGDLVGDKKILALYIYGALMGVILYLVSFHFILPENYIGAYAVGASAAVMAVTVAAGILAPDYKLHLLLVGPVSIKYIVLFFVIADLVGTTGMINTGGHFAHLGGAIWGWIFISNLKSGRDFSIGFNKFVGYLNEKLSVLWNRPKMKVVHKDSGNYSRDRAGKSRSEHMQEVDRILEKIHRHGYESLTAEEKQFLFDAGKNND
jgi:membrane associated rhomboid family serine protease